MTPNSRNVQGVPYSSLLGSGLFPRTIFFAYATRSTIRRNTTNETRDMTYVRTKPPLYASCMSAQCHRTRYSWPTIPQREEVVRFFHTRPKLQDRLSEDALYCDKNKTGCFCYEWHQHDSLLIRRSMQKVSITNQGHTGSLILSITSLLVFQRCHGVLYESATPRFANLAMVRDLRHKSWIPTCFKVLDRLCNYVLQRRRLRQPEQFLRLRGLEIDDIRNVLRRTRLPTWHIWDAELRCRVH
jgi:hypothetical protein